LVLSGLEGVIKTGEPLLVARAIDQPSHARTTSDRLFKELESFNGLLDEIQSTLAKKLGFVEGPKGKKGGQNSFGAWSAKLSRSLEKMTNVKSLDSPTIYVDTLARLCQEAQVIDRHLSLVAGGTQPTVYDCLTAVKRGQIEQRFRRAADFFGSVICKFVMRDIGLLLDKHVKRAGVTLLE